MGKFETKTNSLGCPLERMGVFKSSLAAEITSGVAKGKENSNGELPRGERDGAQL